MAKFLTGFEVRLISPETPSKKALWEIVEDFIYQSDKYGVIIIPKGSVTDFASVPRVPVLFLLTGSLAHRGAAIHDFLYKTHTIHRPGGATEDITRKQADEILLECALIDLDKPVKDNAGAWKRVKGTVHNANRVSRAYMIYAGVRTFGWLYWK